MSGRKLSLKSFSNAQLSRQPALKQPTKGGDAAMTIGDGQFPLKGAANVQSECRPTSSNPRRSASKARTMNKTEAAFALILEAKKQAGEIDDYRYEGMRLKWGVDEKTGQAMWYKADFVVIRPKWDRPDDYHHRLQIGQEIALMEIKAGHIWDISKVRFKGCRAAWPQFEFEMWQKKKTIWTRIL